MQRDNNATRFPELQVTEVCLAYITFHSIHLGFFIIRRWQQLSRNERQNSWLIEI